jgi:hypothetical protein
LEISKRALENPFEGIKCYFLLNKIKEQFTFTRLPYLRAYYV